jgi:DNA replicative helicase MCM subunit Mcm2 (Cdc46/Mcm family)
VNDIIFKLGDSSDVERDHNVATYLLNCAIQGAGFDVVEDDITKDAATNMQQNPNFSLSNETPWSMEKLRAYISLVKDRFRAYISLVKDQFQPCLSDDAALLLEHHYEKCRSVRNTTIPVPVRFLESLI